MKKQIAMLLAVVLVFAAFNAGVYFLLTGRLSNNFSGTNQSKMVDVGMFLPHEEGSDLPRIDASLQLTGNLPVLDGAAGVMVTGETAVGAYPVEAITYLSNTVRCGQEYLAK